MANNEAPVVRGGVGCCGGDDVDALGYRHELGGDVLRIRLVGTGEGDDGQCSQRSGADGRRRGLTKMQDWIGP